MSTSPYWLCPALVPLRIALAYFGTLDYAAVFARAGEFANTRVAAWGASEWSLLTMICICLFIGAMGKSAQVPLHVWLPDAMEGPTPISALIHAATMVTAGIFMVARMSPLFELSETALSFVTDRRRDRPRCSRRPRHRPERHQARAGLLDAVAARLHDVAALGVSALFGRRCST